LNLDTADSSSTSEKRCVVLDDEEEEDEDDDDEEEEVEDNRGGEETSSYSIAVEAARFFPLDATPPWYENFDKSMPDPDILTRNFLYLIN
jgi:hypothetical protein